jgi:hypothetical protein
MDMEVDPDDSPTTGISSDASSMDVDVDVDVDLDLDQAQDPNQDTDVDPDYKPHRREPNKPQKRGKGRTGRPPGGARGSINNPAAVGKRRGDKAPAVQAPLTIKLVTNPEVANKVKEALEVVEKDLDPSLVELLKRLINQRWDKLVLLHNYGAERFDPRTDDVVRYGKFEMDRWELTRYMMRMAILHGKAVRVSLRFLSSYLWRQSRRRSVRCHMPASHLQ